jgi:hypothetical protein
MSFWKPGAAEPMPSASQNTKSDAKRSKDGVEGMQGKRQRQSDTKHGVGGTEGKRRPSTTSVNSINNMDPHSSMEPQEPQEPPRKLSKSVMGMNFMKMKQHTSKTVKSDAPPKSVVQSGAIGAIGAIVCVKEGFDFSALLPGRRSFNGCNKFVESFYEQRMEDLQIRKKSKPEKASNSSTVSNEEMMKRYEGLVGLPRGPNQGKRPVEKSGGQKKKGPEKGPGKGVPDAFGGQKKGPKKAKLR